MAPSNDERDLRANRILDAAEELVVAWGSRKVTIDDVARRAQVGKGTVYLHFATKDALLLTVVMRAQLSMLRRLLDSMRQDPENIRPGALARMLYLSLFDAPLLRSVFSDDSEALNSISRSAGALISDVVQQRVEAMRTYWDLLREYALVRTDRSRDDQIYAYNSIVIGHLVAEPLLSGQGLYVPDGDTRADLISQSVRSLVEEGGTPEDARSAQPEVIDLFTALERRLHGEISHQKQTTRTT